MEPTQKLETIVTESPVIPAPEGPVSPTGITLKQYLILVASGAFVTTFAQQRVLGNLPTTLLLKDHLHLPKDQIAFFFFWATFAWSIKPIAGIFTDAFPIFGTRRRHYMLLGTGMAGLLWFVMMFCDNSFIALLIVSAFMNGATVFASTVMGGLMVEAGQVYNAPGRISSLRQFVQSVAGIGGPLVGGFLAGKAFGWQATTGIAGGAAISLSILTWMYLREKPIYRNGSQTEDVLDRPVYRIPIFMIIGLATVFVLATYLFSIKEVRSVGISLYALLATFGLILGIVFAPTRNNVIIKAQWQLVSILQSRTLWMAVTMLFLVYTVPGMNTALVFQQTDVIHLSPTIIGRYTSLEGVLGVIGAGLYALFCRKLNLRILLIGGIGINAIVTLGFLLYNAGTAPFIHSASGFVTVISELALMDLAVRSTPRGCEALGFALMMSVRNFGIAVSDIIGTKMMEQFHFSFNKLVVINASTTLLVLLFVPFLPRLVMSRKEGEV
ncbi:MAG: MFS transporter [Chthonomonadales bacterium]